MKKVLLLCRQQTPAIQELSRSLAEFFGAQRIAFIQTVPAELTSNDVVVALLSDSHGKAGGLPLDDMEKIEASGLAQAFEQHLLVVPVLLDDAQMPAHESMPTSVRPLAFCHALPVRTGDELRRDLGRLIIDLEALIQEPQHQAYAWDLWLLPVGVTGAILSFPFLFLWLLDVWYWTYSYETVEGFHKSRRTLELVGPMLLGISLLVFGLGFQWRRYRLYLERRLEFFQTGSGTEPDKIDVWSSLAIVLAMASLGLGVWAGIPAIVLLLLRVELPLGRISHARKWPSLAWWLALTMAVLSSSWSLWRTSVLDRFESCLAQYEQGVQLVDAGDLELAQQKFESALRVKSDFGQAYQGLAAIASRRNEPDRALEQLTLAIGHYPTSNRGWFEPDRHLVASAYRSRAVIERARGQVDLAETDSQMADQLSPWLNLFSGWLRFW